MFTKIVGPSLVSLVIDQKAGSGRRLRRGSSSGTTDNKGRNASTHELQIESDYSLLYTVISEILYHTVYSKRMSRSL